jgi:hypothetical protein
VLYILRKLMVTRRDVVVSGKPEPRLLFAHMFMNSQAHQYDPLFIYKWSSSVSYCKRHLHPLQGYMQHSMPAEILLTLLLVYNTLARSSVAIICRQLNVYLHQSGLSRLYNSAHRWNLCHIRLATYEIRVDDHSVPYGM